MKKLIIFIILTIIIIVLNNVFFEYIVNRPNNLLIIGICTFITLIFDAWYVTYLTKHILRILNLNK